MFSYASPIDDYHFLLTAFLAFDGAMAELGRKVDTELAVAVLEEAGKMCADQLPAERPAKTAMLRRLGENQHLVDRLAVDAKIRCSAAAALSPFGVGKLPFCKSLPNKSDALPCGRPQCSGHSLTAAIRGDHLPQA